MVNIFFDTEFSHLQDAFNPEPPSLFSIGCISDDGRKFYAENSDGQFMLSSDFTLKTVIPLMEGGEKAMGYVEIAKRLKAWVESFIGADMKPDEVKFWSDAPGFDWPFVKHMFDCHGWPSNLRDTPAPLSFLNPIKNMRFKAAVEDVFASNKALRRHHALDDAMVNRIAFMRVTERRF